MFYSIIEKHYFNYCFEESDSSLFDYKEWKKFLISSFNGSIFVFFHTLMAYKNVATLNGESQSSRKY